jgi:hypothetical protein
MGLMSCFTPPLAKHPSAHPGRSLGIATTQLVQRAWKALKSKVPVIFGKGER